MNKIIPESKLNKKQSIGRKQSSFLVKDHVINADGIRKPPTGNHNIKNDCQNWSTHVTLSGWRFDEEQENYIISVDFPAKIFITKRERVNLQGEYNTLKKNDPSYHPQ